MIDGSQASEPHGSGPASAWGSQMELALAKELKVVSLASPASSAALAGPEARVAASSGLKESSLLALVQRS